MTEHLPTLLAAVSLGLSGLSGGPPLPPPLDRPNLLRLRDALELADMLPGMPVSLTTDDHRALLTCLLASQSYLDGGSPITGPPDLVAALEQPRLQGALRAVREGLSGHPPTTGAAHA